ncbi:MAG: hypothetical protein ACI4MJ_08410, partial [Aristaeellaceae bacterium]
EFPSRRRSSSALETAGSAHCIEATNASRHATMLPSDESSAKKRVKSSPMPLYKPGKACYTTAW